MDLDYKDLLLLRAAHVPHRVDAPIRHQLDCCIPYSHFNHGDKFLIGLFPLVAKFDLHSFVLPSEDLLSVMTPNTGPTISFATLGPVQGMHKPLV